ncbi:MAG: hypothetical protein AAFP99_09730 [Pseudomonadota bacterium]
MPTRPKSTKRLPLTATLSTAAVLATTPLFAPFAHAAEPTDWFFAETRDDRAAALRELETRASSDNTYRHAYGTALFFGGVENFTRDLIRHGYLSGHERALGRSALPLFSNPMPEPLTYDGLRAILERFETNIENARAVLAEVDQDEPIKITLDLTDVRLQLTENAPGPLPTVSDLLEQQQITPPRTDDENEPEPITEFTFDNADAIWLEGYSNVILAQLDFALAHDFEKQFDEGFHLLFPKSGLPLQDTLAQYDVSRSRGFESEQLFDLIGLIHLADFPLQDADRRRNVIRHMGEVTRLSRANWDAILAETDNDREWLPGPQQPGVHPLSGLEVNQEMVDGWMDMLDLADAVLAGETLIQHIRFNLRYPNNEAKVGFNVRAFLESDANFDPVLLLTGHDAVPFMEEGNVLNTNEWRDMRNLFGRRNFTTVALWFN